MSFDYSIHPRSILVIALDNVYIHVKVNSQWISIQFIVLLTPTRSCPGFFPGFSECRVFSAGMKIVIDKNLENECF
jgi:hypothetical protein